MDLEREVNELKRIAALYRKRGKLRLAAEILKTAVSIEKGIHGPQSRPVALMLYELGELHCDMEEFETASPLFVEAVDIWQKAHPHSTDEVMGYASSLLRLQEEYDKQQLANERFQQPDDEETAA